MSEIQGSQPHIPNVFPIMEQEQDPLLKSRHGWEVFPSLSGTFLFFSMLFIHYPAPKGTKSVLHSKDSVSKRKDLGFQEWGMAQCCCIDVIKRDFQSKINHSIHPAASPQSILPHIWDTYLTWG